ncbi:MAG: hypothetical protein ACOYLO_00015 [Ferruginibacter sp.]
MNSKTILIETLAVVRRVNAAYDAAIMAAAIRYLEHVQAHEEAQASGAYKGDYGTLENAMRQLGVNGKFAGHERHVAYAGVLNRCEGQFKAVSMYREGLITSKEAIYRLIKEIEAQDV